MCCRNSLVLSMIIILVLLFSLIGVLICLNAQSPSDNLQAISTQVQTSTGAPTQIIFNTNRVQNGKAITHTDNSAEINIASGTYLVNYSLTGSLVTGGEPTSFFVSLYQDNIIIEGSTVTSLVIPSGQEMTVSGSSLVQVDENSTITLIANSTSNIAYQDANISVMRIGK